jgi:multiple sugar transport system ATP-binding protein
MGDERALQETADAPTQTTMVGRFGARSQVKQSETVEVCVDTRALHFFDPETGLGIYDDTKEDK